MGLGGLSPGVAVTPTGLGTYIPPPTSRLLHPPPTSRAVADSRRRGPRDQHENRHIRVFKTGSSAGQRAPGQRLRLRK
eukprot:scaffold27_cov33-Phaeocystis_antarctica.AAC.2